MSESIELPAGCLREVLIYMFLFSDAGHNQHNTLSKDQKLHVISRRSENTFDLLPSLPVRKQILKHKKTKKTLASKIIMHNYIIYKGDPTYVFPVCLRVYMVFTDYPTGSGYSPCGVLEICKYLMHPWVNWKICSVGLFLHLGVQRYLTHGPTKHDIIC